jgi:hypothetical protein
VLFLLFSPSFAMAGLCLLLIRGLRRQEISRDEAGAVVRSESIRALQALRIARRARPEAMNAMNRMRFGETR